MLDLQVTKPAQPKWGSPIVFQPEKDVTLRFSMDYRKLNAVAVRDSYPIPCMDRCKDRLRDATIVSTLYRNNGYWKVEIAKGDREKGTFKSHHGLLLPIRMLLDSRPCQVHFSLQWNTSFHYSKGHLHWVTWMTSIYIRKAWKHIPNWWDSSWPYCTTKVSWSYCRNASSSPMQSSTWDTSSTQDSWGYHNTQSTQFLTWSTLWISLNYDRSEARAKSSDIWFLTSRKLRRC